MTIIFDFDGTIADTHLLIFQCFNEIAPKYRLPILRKSDLKTLRSLSLQEVIQKYRISPWKLFFLTRDIRSRFKKHIPNIALIPGIKSLFCQLQSRNINIGVVTSNSKVAVERCFKRQGITNTTFMHSEKNLFGKGKTLKNLLRKRKIPRAVYIGDEVRDIDAAREAKIPIISVTWGFNSKMRLAKARPDYLISTPQQILRIASQLRDRVLQ